MKFKKVAEAFNYYRNKSVADLEARAKEINNIIDTDSNADIEALNIELRGIKEARENIELRSADPAAGLNLITGRELKGDDVKKFEGEDAAGTKEYRSAFYKTLMGKALTPTEQAAFKAVTEKRSGDEFNNSTNAAAVLPTTTLNEILKKARTLGGLIAEARAFNMPTKISIPIATPSANASWHTEGDPVDTEKVSLAKVTFDGYEILKIFSISAKVKTMSINAFESYLADELTACVMGTIEDALVNGTGSGQGTGLEAITWVDDTNQITVPDSVSGGYYTWVVKAAALLPRGYAKGAKWAMNNKTLYNRFYGCMDDNGRALLINNAQTDAINFVLGFPVIVDDNIADDDVYLGNFNKYLGYNMPGGIALESSRESSFKSGLIDYRAMAVADCKPLIEDAFVKLVFDT